MGAIRDVNPHLGHKDDVIPQNINIVHEVCHRYKKHANRKGIDYDDMFGTGCIGLVKAFDMYVPTKQSKFSTYAFVYVDGYIRNFVRDHCGLIHVPRRVLKVARLIKELGLLNTESDIVAREIGCSIQYVENGKSIIRRAIISLDEPLVNQKGDSLKVIDSVANEEDFSSAGMIEFMGTLSGSEKEIVGRLLMGQNKQTICRDMGKSAPTIRQVTRKIGEKLLAYIG